MKKRNLLKWLLPLAVLGIALLVVKIRRSEGSNDLTLTNMAKEVNRACPVMIDSDTRLDSAKASSGDTIRFHYTMVNIRYDSINLPRLQRNLGTNLFEAYKSSPDLKFYRENQVTMVYEYFDRAGDFVTRITVGPDALKR